MPRILTIIFLNIILSSSILFADYHYASHAGSNISPYVSWETASDSVNTAVEAADPGDTVYIAAGDYEGLVIMYPADSLIAIIGAGADSTFLFTRQQHFLIYAGPKTYYRGLKLSCVEGYNSIWAGTAGRDIIVEDCLFEGPGEGIVTASSHAIIRNCIFENMGIMPSIADDHMGTLSLEVTHCLFRNNWGQAIGVQSLYAIVRNNIATEQSAGMFSFYLYYIDGAYQEITNNICYRTISGGIGVGIADTNSSVSNNVIDRNHYPGIGPSWCVYIGSPLRTRMVNNSITNSDRGIMLQSDSVCAVHYNNLNGNGRDFGHIQNYHGSFDTTLGLLHADPMYVNPESGDFRLQAYSPLIDAGDPSIIDVDGTRSDIGCYGGPGGCSYTYLDLAPQIPDLISGRVDSNVIVLSWRMNTEADFNRYQVFRDTFPGFAPSVFNKVAEPETCLYRDSLFNFGTSYYYRLTAVDNQHNVSDYSDEVAVRPVSIKGFDTGDNLPQYNVITSAYPNPFNNQITLVYSASNLGPQPSEVKLIIYDVTGRVVRTLVNEHKPVGTYRVVWDGKDDNGEPVASGSYLARVSQWGMSGGDFPIKITLVK